METKFYCTQCKQEKVHISDISTGYGTNKQGEKICFVCCGENDKQELKALKPKEKFYLYWDGKYITNWPGSLQIEPMYIKKGKHNFCRTRTDVYFRIDGKGFHGVQMGDFNQVLHVNTFKQL